MSAETDEQQFMDTPEGWAARLKLEFAAARRALECWHREAKYALNAFLDDRPAGEEGHTHWNIHTSDTQTREAMLFGKTPQTSVSRRFADAKDDPARVAAEIQERMLSSDVDSEDDTFAEAIAHANMDREHVGFGAVRVRYDMGTPVKKAGKEAITRPGADGVPVVVAPEVPATEERPDEQVETDFVHWQDWLHGACRVWREVPWIAFASEMTVAEAEKKFGPVAKELPTRKRDGSKADNRDKSPDPWNRVRVWEVWVKDGRQVFFFVEEYKAVIQPLDVAPEAKLANGGVADPLGLKGFFPCPKPMFANLTNMKLVPKPDYTLAKDLFTGVNELATRIDLLEKAVRVIGIYDKSNAALRQLLQNGRGNEMVPVDSWAQLAEKGGLKGVVDWFPLEQVVNAMMVLRDQMDRKVDHLRQLTGMSDIMRGQATEGGRTATSDRITARFGSVRMQRRQDELARFASDTQKLRAEVMAKHFSESTYLARCNCENTPDAPLAQQAVQLLKQDFAKYRIEVKPENLSMTDFDALKQERTEVLTAIGQFMAAVQPIAAAMPSAMPALLEILQWMVAGIRGGSTIESVLDRAIAAAEQAAQQPTQPQPDPKAQAQAMKGQQDMQKIDKELQADIVRAQVDVQAERAKQAAQTEFNVAEKKAEAAIQHAMPKPMPAGAPR